MDKVTTYRGSHRSISFEIKRFDDYRGNKKWTFYLYLKELQFSKEVFKKLWLKPRWYTFGGKKTIVYDYCKCDIINAIDFHGGCTWYSKEAGYDKESKCVKVGCDYSHLYDDIYIYSENILEFDAKRAIDSLYIAVPDIKKWCWHCGDYGIEGYVEPRNDGNYICSQCWEKVDKKNE